MTRIRKAIVLLVLGGLVAAVPVIDGHETNLRGEAPATYGTEVRSEVPVIDGHEINLRGEAPAAFGSERLGEAPFNYGSERLG